MKLRTAVAGLAGTVGATAVANRMLNSRAGEFEPFLDGDQGTYRWRGFDISYTEVGDPENQDLLLFHGTGAASSSHEFYRVIDELSDDFHVIAPDLPGYGHSDRPPLLYSASLYSTFVADVIEDLSAEPPVVVASSLSGSYAASAANEVAVEELILVCPTDSTMGNRQTWLRSLVRSPVIGEGLFNLMVSKRGLRHFHEDHGYHDIANLTEEMLDYEWQTTHQPGARYPVASFVSGFLDPEEPLEQLLTGVDIPVTFIWGRNADTTPLSKGRTLAEAVDAGLIVFDKTKLLPHVEHPLQFIEVVRDGIPVEH